MKYTKTQLEAVKEFLYKIADDQLILGHRDSEWTGLGPVLEEDIAFSSIAQDKIGQSLHIYEILHALGEKDPDTIAFTRNANEFKCCHLVEYPIGEYDFSLIRNFFFCHAEHIRFNMLAESSLDPLAKLAKKYRGEIKYHVMHADTWVKQLGRANEESHKRMQDTIDNSFNLALGIFEESPFTSELNSMNIFEGEKTLQNKWIEAILPVLEKAKLVLPDPADWKPAYGGRTGTHTEYLQPMLEEMGEVFRLDPKAEW
ncbi:MAG: phenylacetate-CoA oxygenase subunit PaaC [Ignavibacteria bacterium]|nr:phenylacetate-CoA oxygenase subunit PaaC [Ignavibacteria bacterium]MCC7159678.1 phenylacetate-CoA oxygenase subunit PaaC [Ignavibacteria bacterium]